MKNKFEQADMNIKAMKFLDLGFTPSANLQY